MEPNIPVGSEGAWPRNEAGRGGRPNANSSEGATASGWPTGRWSTSSARSGRRWARPISWAAPSRALTYGPEDAAGLTQLEPAPRTLTGARDLSRVALQYGNAFLRGFQAAALKPADFFGNDDVLYLMEDVATGEIRMSSSGSGCTRRRPSPRPMPPRAVRAGDRLHARALRAPARRGVRQAPQAAKNRDVHDDSKDTTLPIAREIVRAMSRAR